MKATQRLDDLGHNRRLGDITGGLGSSQSHGLYIGDSAVTASTAAIQISRQEK